jgi:putative heme iron utilization protein
MPDGKSEEFALRSRLHPHFQQENIMKIAFGIIAILVVFIMAIAVAILKKKTGNQPGKEYPYAPKAVMSKVEQTLYFRLVEALPERIILTQVQMSSFLKVTNRQAGWAPLNKIREKSADFVICNKDSSVRAVIELQDSTHERADRQKSDTFKRGALMAAGIWLIEFHAKTLPSVEEIKKTMRP